MGKKKPATRKGQYKKASAQRASRKKRQNISRSARFITFASVGGVLIIALSWIFISGTANMWKNQAVNAFFNQTERTGFTLANVYLSGNNKLSKQAILHHSQLHYGQPILDISLDGLQKRLEALPQIRNAQINRQLPNNIHIHITERKPAALWQEDERLHLIDIDGVLMGTGDPAKHNHLPLLVGKKAPQNLGKLFTLLQTAPNLGKLLDSAIFVGKRRWNIWLKNGIEIKLPEENSNKALARLETLHSTQPLEGESITSIDLRIPERMFIHPKVKLVQQTSHKL